MSTRPKYNSAITPTLVKWMARAGLNEEQIAFNLELKVNTFRRWIKKYPELEEALQEGRDYSDAIIEESLFQRAKGYTVTIEERKDGDKPFVKQITKHYAPDVTAMIFWLKNRRPDSWRDVRQLDLDMAGKSTDELLEEAKELTKAIQTAKDK